MVGDEGQIRTGIHGLETVTIKEVEVRPEIQHDSSILASLLADIDNLEAFVADSGYLSCRNLRLIADRGGTL